jgi:hypothetical protein
MLNSSRAPHPPVSKCRPAHPFPHKPEALKITSQMVIANRAWSIGQAAVKVPSAIGNDPVSPHSSRERLVETPV